MEAQVNRVALGRQMVAFVPGERHRQEHSCDAASAQHRAGRRHRQARQLCRAHLEQSDQVQIRGRPLSAQFQARNHLGRSLLQGFRQPARQARPCAGAGAGAFRRSGDPRRRGRRRPLGDHRHLGLQRIAGRGKPAARRRIAAGHSRDRPCGHRPELPRQSQRRRKAVHQYRRPHRHHGGRPGRDRRSIRRDRDGDPPGAGGSRRRRRLHGHHRQRGRARDAGSDGLFRRRSLDPRDRGLPGRRAQHQGVPPGLQGRARRRQAGDRAQARGIRGRPRRRDGAYRRARRLDRDLRRHLDPRGRDPGPRPRRIDRNHRMLCPCRPAKGQSPRRRDAVGRQARPA